MSQKIISLSDSHAEIKKKILERGYVYIKSKYGFITRDEVSVYSYPKTLHWQTLLTQESYGKTWAYTMGELTRKEQPNE